jgi:hypothetical protein
MDVLDIVKPSKGLEVDTEVVAGSKSQELATGAVVGKKQTNNTSNKADTINQTYTTNKVDYGISISNIALLMLMSFLVGWLAFPDLIHMWKMRLL